MEENDEVKTNENRSRNSILEKGRNKLAVKQ